MSEAPFTIERAGDDEKSFTDVFALLVALHREGGFAPMNLEDATEAVFKVLQEGMTFLARADDGAPIGVLGLTEIGFWFNRAFTFLQDMGFYVAPQHRLRPGASGPFPGTALLRAARDEGQKRNKLVFMSIDNPDRRPKRTRMSLQAQELGFIPVGYTLKLN